MGTRVGLMCAASNPHDKRSPRTKCEKEKLIWWEMKWNFHCEDSKEFSLCKLNSGSKPEQREISNESSRTSTWTNISALKHSVEIITSENQLRCLGLVQQLTTLRVLMNCFDCLKSSYASIRKISKQTQRTQKKVKFSTQSLVKTQMKTSRWAKGIPVVFRLPTKRWK